MKLFRSITILSAFAVLFMAGAVHAEAVQTASGTIYYITNPVPPGLSASTPVNIAGTSSPNITALFNQLSSLRAEVANLQNQFQIGTSSVSVFPPCASLFATTSALNASSTLHSMCSSTTGVLPMSNRVQTTDKLHVRSAPSAIAKILGTVLKGDMGTVVSSTTTSQGGYTWTEVSFDNGLRGFVAQEFLSKISGITPIVGSRVMVTERAHVRSAPQIPSTVLGTESKGELGTITAGPSQGPNYQWWNIRFDSGLSGWMAANFISAISFGSPTSTPTTTQPTSPDAPQLKSLAPDSGQIGTNVTVKGENFTPDSYITFGGGAITPTFVNSGKLSFTVPSSVGPHCAKDMACPMYLMLVQPGTYMISVSNASGTSNTLPFTIGGKNTTTTSAARVTSPAAGKNFLPGQEMTISWSGFDDANVSISYEAWPSCLDSNPHCMIAVIPQKIAGNVSGGSYRWAVPSSLSGDYKIIVSTADQSATSGTFTVSRICNCPMIPASPTASNAAGSAPTASSASSCTCGISGPVQ